jgi:hypothetical protein
MPPQKPRAIEPDDDVEGHGHSGGRVTDDDVEGHKRYTEDDVEGHGHSGGRVTDEDDVEGHKR